MDFRQARLAAVAALIALAGCTTTTVSERPYLTPGAPQQAPSALSSARDQLATLEGHGRIQTALRWSDQYLDSERPQDAEALLRSLEADRLSDRQHQHWLHNRLRALLMLRNEQRALALYEQEYSRTLAYPANDQARIELLAADAASQQGQYLSSVRLRISAIPMLPRREREPHYQALWQQLLQLSPEQLERLQDEDDQELRGWVSLAQLYRDPVSDLDAQLEAFSQWQRQWSGHPAADQIPNLRSALETAARERPQQVAVLLPESGPLAESGRALRDGIMTAYYVSQQQQSHTPTLQFYDSSRGNIIDIYYRAVDDGADLVLGPLDRGLAAEIAQHGPLPVPTLALNYIEQSDLRVNNFYQFGLAPEDEARQIANYNLERGARQAGVLYPQGSWGERVAQSFIDYWQEQGGSIAAVSSYQEGATLGDTVKDILLVAASEQRSREISRFTNLKVDATPSPRQDMSFLFLVANPQQGRQVKPALNFHYASQLPVYSTALIYAGQPNPQQDHDLNGIHFVDMPWLLGQGHEDLREAAREQWPDGQGRFERLFAMGIDAFRLQGRLNLLVSLPGAELPGVTGRLTLVEGRVVRELDWATFQRGLPTPQPRVKEIPDDAFISAQN